MKLRGGVVSFVDGSQVLALVIILVLVHSTLAALMWSNTIQFASNDAKLGTAIPLTVIAVFLIAYMMIIGFSNS